MNNAFFALRKYIDLIDENRFDEFYDQINNNDELSIYDVGKTTKLLMEADIDPLPYLSRIPTGLYCECDIVHFVTNKNIDFGACFKATKLFSVVINEGCTDIGNSAFCECHELEHVALPSTLQYIPPFIFEHCYKLREITYNGTRAEFMLIEKDRLWNANMPSFKVCCKDGDLKYD